MALPLIFKLGLNKLEYLFATNNDVYLFLYFRTSNESTSKTSNSEKRHYIAVSYYSAASYIIIIRYDIQ